MDEEIARIILGMLGIKVNLNKVMVKTQEGIECDMCKAWDDHKEKGHREGHLEGRQEEQKEGLISLVNILSTIFPDFDAIYNKIISKKVL